MPILEDARNFNRMDLTLGLSLIAVAVSAAALLVTTILTLFQIKLSRHSHYLPIVELISEFRSRELYDDVVYVTTRLRFEHDPSLGISGLPEASRSSLLNVAYYFQSFAWLGELGVLHQKHLQLVAGRIVLIWEAIEPYVQAERAVTQGPVLVALQRSYDNLALRGPKSASPLGRTHEAHASSATDTSANTRTV